ncbi:N-acetylmuramoyl-L-alanine amidase C-terminal domain-containing protein [Bacillus cereus]
MSDVLLNFKIIIYSRAVLFGGEGSTPYVLTEKLANPQLDYFTAWLDEKKWWYQYE